MFKLSSCSWIMLTSNESLENRGKLLKGTTGKILSQEGGFLGNFSCIINESWFTVNEKCTHTIN